MDAKKIINKCKVTKICAFKTLDNNNVHKNINPKPNTP